MHAANFSDAVSGLELAVVVGLLDDPHAAVANAQQITASAITPPGRAQRGVAAVVSLRNTRRCRVRSARLDAST
jgi:hypothetical protein